MSRLPRSLVTSLALLLAIGVFSPPLAHAAVPPTPFPQMIGQGHWDATGTYPQAFHSLRIVLPSDHYTTKGAYLSRMLALMNTHADPRENGNVHFVSFTLKREWGAKPDTTTPPLLQAAGQSALELREGEVFPLVGQLLTATNIKQASLSLGVVDRESVPAEVWPQKRSRVIASNQPKQPLIHIGNHPPAINGRRGNRPAGRILLAGFDESTDKATVAVARLTHFDGHNYEFGKPKLQSVGQGDLIVAGDYRFRVLNVVAPQTIENVGHLVGWIEIDPEPVKEKNE